MEPFQQTIPAWRPPTKKVPDLGPEQAHVWRIPLQEALNSKTVRRCRRLLSREEIERSESFQAPTQGNQFIIYRGALRILLSRYTRYWARRIRYDYSPNGKPALHPPRYFPSDIDLDFSVSHSKNDGSRHKLAANRSRRHNQHSRFRNLVGERQVVARGACGRCEAGRRANVDDSSQCAR